MSKTAWGIWAAMAIIIALGLGLAASLADLTNVHEDTVVELANMRMGRDHRRLERNQYRQLLDACQEVYANQRDELDQVRKTADTYWNSIIANARVDLDRYSAVSDATNRLTLARITIVAAFNHTTRGKIPYPDNLDEFIDGLSEIMRREVELSSIWISNITDPELRSALAGLYLIDTALRRLRAFAPVGAPE